MKIHTDQAGFTAFELILVVVVLGAVAVAALRVMNNHHTLVSSAPVTTKVTSDKAPVVNKASDLTKSEATLDQNDPTVSNAGDSNQLDAELNALN